MKNILFTFLLAILLASCGQNNTTYKDTNIFGLASPIQLTGDSTRIIQSDYFTSPVIIDSIVTDDSALQVSYIDDYIFIVANQDNRSISNLTLYAEGIPYSFLVKGNTTYNGKYIRLPNNEKRINQLQIKSENRGWTLFNLLETDDTFRLDYGHYKPGKYHYKLVADGKEIDDHSNTIKISNGMGGRSEEHTSELKSRSDLVCRLRLDKKNESPYGIPTFSFHTTCFSSYILFLQTLFHQ